MLVGSSVSAEEETAGSHLGGLFCKEGVPGRLLVIAAAKLLIDGQDDVSLKAANHESAMPGQSQRPAAARPRCLPCCPRCRLNAGCSSTC